MPNIQILTQRVQALNHLLDAVIKDDRQLEKMINEPHYYSSLNIRHELNELTQSIDDCNYLIQEMEGANEKYSRMLSEASGPKYSEIAYRAKQVSTMIDEGILIKLDSRLQELHRDILRWLEHQTKMEKNNIFNALQKAILKLEKEIENLTESLYQTSQDKFLTKSELEQLISRCYEEIARLISFSASEIDNKLMDWLKIINNAVELVEKSNLVADKALQELYKKILNTIHTGELALYVLEAGEYSFTDKKGTIIRFTKEELQNVLKEYKEGLFEEVTEEILKEVENIILIVERIQPIQTKRNIFINRVQSSTLKSDLQSELLKKVREIPAFDEELIKEKKKEASQIRIFVYNLLNGKRKFEILMKTTNFY